MDRDVLLRAYAIIGDKTPMLTDCGLMCGAACCQPDEDGQGGMLLFPGEEGLYDPLPEGFSRLFRKSSRPVRRFSMSRQSSVRITG